MCAQVKAGAAQFDQDKDIFLFSIRECQDNYIMTHDAFIKGIYKRRQCQSKIEDKGQFFK